MPGNERSEQTQLLEVAHIDLIKVPVIDASEEGVDLSRPLAKMVEAKDMMTEPLEGSLGLIFYTISSPLGLFAREGSVDFSVHAFFSLSESPEMHAIKS